MWKSLVRGSSTKVHGPLFFTTSQTEYFPLGTAWPSSVMS